MLRIVFKSYFAVIIMLTVGFLVLESSAVNAQPDSDNTSFDIEVVVSGAITIACSDGNAIQMIGDGPNNTIDGLAGGTATSGLATCTTTTNNATGYIMDVNATSSPNALTLTDNTSYTFDDATGTTNTFELHFGDMVGDSETGFGFSASSTPGDMDAAFLTNGSACSTGALSSNTVCFRGFDTTNPISNTIRVIDRSTSASGGVPTEFIFLAKSGSSANPQSGTYKATMVVTVTNNN